MTISWRANVSGVAADTDDEAVIFAIVNALCRVLGAEGLFITDAADRAGAKVIPTDDS